MKTGKKSFIGRCSFNSLPVLWDCLGNNLQPLSTTAEEDAPWYVQLFHSCLHPTAQSYKYFAFSNQVTIICLWLFINYSIPSSFLHSLYLFWRHWHYLRLLFGYTNNQMPNSKGSSSTPTVCSCIVWLILIVQSRSSHLLSADPSLFISFVTWEDKSYCQALTL